MKIVAEKGSYRFDLPGASDAIYMRIAGYKGRIVAGGFLHQDELRQYIALCSGDVVGLKESLPTAEKPRAEALIDLLYSKADNPLCRDLIEQINRTRGLMAYADHTDPFDLISHLEAAAQTILLNETIGREPGAGLLYGGLKTEAKILKNSHKMSEKNKVEQLSKEEQLVEVRKILDEIESYPQIMTTDMHMRMGVLQTELGKILALGKKLKPEVLAEATARLKLHNSFVALNQANGVIRAKDETKPMAEAAQKIKRNGMELLGEDYKVLAGAKFNPDGSFLASLGMNGIRVDKSFEALEMAGQDYLAVVEKAIAHYGLPTADRSRLLDPSTLKRDLDNDPLLGTVGTNYFSDTFVERKRIVDNYMKEVMIGGEDPDKALELGKRLILVLRENSVMNRGGFFGTDDPSELIGFMAKRKAEATKAGGKPGPAVHLGRVYSLATSAARYWGKISDVTTSLTAADLPYKLKDGDMEAYISFLGDAQNVREDLLDVNPDIGKRGVIATYQSLIRAFGRAEVYNRAMYDKIVSEAPARKAAILASGLNSAEKKKALGELETMCQPYHTLAFWTVAGDLSLGYLWPSQGGKGWTMPEFNAIKTAVSDEKLWKGITGSEATFLSKDEWKELDKMFVGYYVWSQGKQGLFSGMFGRKKK